MIARLEKISISQQAALLTAGLCLLVSSALVGLAAVSGLHMQLTRQQEFGSALANQLSHRIAARLETGNLLGVNASLQRFVRSTAAEQAAIYDVEGKVIGQSGDAVGRYLNQYRADIRIEDDVAGEVVVTLNSDTAYANQRRLLLTLGGLAVVLSLAVYGIAHYLSQRLARRLNRLVATVALDDAPAPPGDINELARLEKGVQSLPLELLRTRSSGDPADEDYRTTAVLYLHLVSLSNYVDTLDHEALQRYIARLHRAIYAAAGFYGGQLQVVRQFGLALYFCGSTGPDQAAGSPAFRAAACSWLVQAVCEGMEQDISLSMNVAMAIDQSELGAGSGSDIYPGLYIQHTLDNLHALCGSQPPRVLLSPTVCADADVENRVEQHATELQDYGMLDSFIAPHSDLLERQLQLILRRLQE
mgnify:FL=1